MWDGYPATPFDAEEAEFIVSSVFWHAEPHYWDGKYFPLQTRDEVRAYCRHHSIPPEQPEAADVPHVAATARDTQPYVWAVDFDQAPSYWFPRDCPRVLTWVSSGNTTHDRERFLGAASRVHAIEYAWLDKAVDSDLRVPPVTVSDWRPMPAAGPIVGYLTPDRRAYVA